MNIRFRKRIRIFPGIYLNFSKQGFTSVSISFRFITINLGKGGIRFTASAKGTGLSVSEYKKY
jgi:hypothetical protein